MLMKRIRTCHRCSYIWFSCWKDFISLKAEAIFFNKFVNVPTIFNNLKTKADDLDVGGLKAVLVDMKKLSYVIL